MTGRAVSAAIHQSLKDALLQGEPLTYQQLAERAGCTVRSVRNYLARAEEIFGFPVDKSRDSEHRVVVRAQGTPRARTRATPPTDPFHGALCRALFPDDQQASAQPEPVVVAFQGLPAYSMHQANVARAWALAASDGQPTAYRLTLRQPQMSVVLWPVAVVVHANTGVILVGIPPAAPAPDQLVTLPLASVADEADAIAPDRQAVVPAFDPRGIELEAWIDLPFSGLRPDPREPTVDVHVRFEPTAAARVLRRVWHRSQRVVLRRDGELDVRFGPVPLAAAASWAASFGSALSVLGDKKLRKAVKKRSFVP